MTWIFLAIIIFQSAVILWLAFGRRTEAPSAGPAAFNTPERVADFYNQTTDKFLQVYGEIIQAFRTKDVSQYLDYTIKSARIQDGMRVLDAGCGVAGPAIYFAQQLPGLSVDAISISSTQISMAGEKVNAAGLQERVRLTEGDYHKTAELFEKDTYDRVYFLESFGHSNDKKQAIEQAWEVLKPGGMLYIKDLFRRESDNEWEQLRINHICEQINTGYEYHIADLGDVLSYIRRKGYILHYVKVPEVEMSAFEHLSISNEFQNLFDVSKIDSWEGYVFPIDFYEILAEKPAFNLAEDRHLYFMNREA